MKHFQLLFLSLTIVAIFFPGLSASAPSEKYAFAPNFSAITADGKNISLNDFLGAPLIVHITNIEVPLCRECEKSLSGQLKELARLKAIDADAQIVTLNLRKNPYSNTGKSLAESLWKVNITWPWIEDAEP